jgi:hypothetical protein
MSDSAASDARDLRRNAWRLRGAALSDATYALSLRVLRTSQAPLACRVVIQVGNP